MFVMPPALAPTWLCYTPSPPPLFSPSQPANEMLTCL